MRKLLFLASFAMLAVACQESLEQKAAKEARLYTQKNCPAQMSETLIMDSMAFEAETHTISYYYTLKGAADSIGAINKDEARQSLLTALKNTTSMMAYKEEGYNFAYIYRSQKSPKTILFETTFTKNDY
jgi:hypothetical protein